ncbi:glycosyltransferase [Gramella sp. BOM4]|nr:glycosyltransferase [Christiangramia bathymodioli]
MISIVIPTYNEEQKLPILLKYLEENMTGQVLEILVVDGGSLDTTQKIADENPLSRCISSKKGRAVQMNAGARETKGEVLYFLHADSLPPFGFDQQIMEEVENGKLAGCFRMKFDKKHWWLDLIAWFTRINHISCRGGDQSLFVKRELFEEIGGFDEAYQVYEDNEIIKRLYKRGHFVVIQNWLVTSARLYEKMGILKTQLLFAEIYCKRRFGATAEELSRLYYKRLNS